MQRRVASRGAIFRVHIDTSLQVECRFKGPDNMQGRSWFKASILKKGVHFGHIRPCGSEEKFRRKDFFYFFVLTEGEDSTALEIFP